MKHLTFTLFIGLLLSAPSFGQDDFNNQQPIGDVLLELEFKLKEKFSNFRNKLRSNDVLPTQGELKEFADRSLIIINGDTLVEKSISDFWSDVENSDEFQEGMNEIRRIPPPSEWFPRGWLRIDRAEVEELKKDFDEWIDENLKTDTKEHHNNKNTDSKETKVIKL